ncbi:MAG: hypothetical protein JNL81_01480 [Hyphomonadaceae bacterium]|nr:hypothetical protein [Hyphomonadaceae bacterium]
MRYAGPLTPVQASAFWRLGRLNGDDLGRLAMQWLEEDQPSESVAVLAGESDITLAEHGALFERCLRELNVSPPSERLAAWLYIQTLLQAARDGADPLDVVDDALFVDHKGIALFEPRNLAGDGKAYAAEELGMENLLGLYWTLDDPNLTPKEVKCAMDEMKDECARVLAVFYTEPPND